MKKDSELFPETDIQNEEIPGKDALRACEKFCSHGGTLDRREIDDLMMDAMLA